MKKLYETIAEQSERLHVSDIKVSNFWNNLMTALTAISFGVSVCFAIVGQIQDAIYFLLFSTWFLIQANI